MSKIDTRKKLTPQEKFDFSCHNPDGGQALISCPYQVVNSAIDTAHLTLDLDVKNPLLLSELKKKKEEIQSSTFALSGVFDFGSTELFSWSLNRTGVKNYPYSLTTGDVTLNLSNRAAGSQVPNGSLQIGSLSSQADILALYANIVRWLKLHNIKVLSNKVSRIDPCCDYARHISELNVDNPAFHISRAVKYDPHYRHGAITGLSVGGGDIMLRIYDKPGEMKIKKAGDKQLFFQQKWNSKGVGDVIDVTRFEFQLRRAAIKSFFPDDSSLQTVVKSMGYLWRYLTTQWFRHTETVVDKKNKNHKQAKISDLWKEIENAWGQFTAIIRQRKQPHVSIPDLMAQAGGIMISVCAALGQSPHDEQGNLDFENIAGTASSLIRSKVEEIMQRAIFKKDYKNRAVRAVVSF